MAELGITTLVVVGFPSDATMRDRKNFVRALPGFEGARLNTKHTLFVKFDSVEAASNALAWLQATPFDMDDPSSRTVRASFANQELDLNRGSQRQVDIQAPEAYYQAPRQYPPPEAVVPPAGLMRHTPRYPPQVRSAPPAKRQRGPPATGGMSTVAVMGLQRKGLSEVDVRTVFEGMDGYEACKFAPNAGGCFVKFSSSYQAQAAVGGATAMGIDAELARKELDVGKL
eukprot:CAMPEP_0204269328 /NCGR_PEP_ID=MMETSP0468-20130131/15861_1 /ASSEMBLY_ACC=CAM_ASM_000383 /TAXON_ID=2969 /ORGANISM="Oxyrrhis marina" /LENGTH=227 /DNA_ID=CAMNT_0051244701 /DNA_START=63 /DNA_END=746 /DNA_ORIENTATION=+